MSRKQADTEDLAPTRDGMPVLGLGTWENRDLGQCAASVETALETGYRHVDTAQAYDNEAGVGEGLAAADVPREELFLATKVWVSNLAYDDVVRSTKESLDRLGTDYVDLLYVHWPARAYDPEDTLTAFAELRDDGYVQRVGVSNFEPEHLEEARDVLGELPFANQVEMHPLLPRKELREYAAENEIELVAYSPLARGSVFDVPEIREVAEKHDASAAQVSLAWLRGKGVAAIPKATGRDHIRDNWDSLSVELDEEDVETIDGIERRERIVHPDFAPDSW